MKLRMLPPRELKLPHSTENCFWENNQDCKQISGWKFSTKFPCSPCVKPAIKSTGFILPFANILLGRSAYVQVNKPRANGDNINVEIAIEPDDKPINVISFGSPPNRSIFSLTHFRARIISCIP
ncbi:hypothetical protein DERP_010022 [Dermatophagoides pteronyssinus]|uniref:Uncharacterized protein n=1 Tax=Dermatophagoides pteronyssinus TaxID=6956 RepID=A0ABQ8J2B6_DERPT|nr:hypothetical protein DERP_010022 [Dermatophagoides pteronyssinus]